MGADIVSIFIVECVCDSAKAKVESLASVDSNGNAMTDVASCDNRTMFSLVATVLGGLVVGVLLGVLGLLVVIKGSCNKKRTGICCKSQQADHRASRGTFKHMTHTQSLRGSIGDSVKNLTISEPGALENLGTTVSVAHEAELFGVKNIKPAHSTATVEEMLEVIKYKKKHGEYSDVDLERLFDVVKQARAGGVPLPNRAMALPASPNRAMAQVSHLNEGEHVLVNADAGTKLNAEEEQHLRDILGANDGKSLTYSS